MLHINRLLLVAVLMFAGFSLLVPEAAAETRVALVIGNGAYQNVPRLPNPVNDANDVASALRRDGFETIMATDLNKDQMDEATIKFAKAARTADVAMFYYSGHALQFAGVNYLAPVDARLTDEADLRRMVRVDEIISDLQQAKNLRILVLDSCRNNPLADELKRSIGTTRALPLQRGLAKIDTPLGMIVSYSTQAGTEADDGIQRNSPYTVAFLKNIEAPEEIGTIFRRISSDVYQQTGHRQLPELSLSLIGEFYLRGKVDLTLQLRKPEEASNSTREEFTAAQSIDTIGSWEAFLQNHPDGYYALLARERENEIRRRDTQKEERVTSLADRKPDATSEDFRSVRDQYKDWKIISDIWDRERTRAVAMTRDLRYFYTTSYVAGAFIRRRASDATKTIGSWKADQSIELLAISPDNSRLAVGLASGGIEIRDPLSGAKLTTLDEHEARGLGFSSDGRQLVSFSFSTEIHIWDVQNGRLLKRLRQTDLRHPINVALLPNYRCIKFLKSSINGEIESLDCETDEKLISFSVGYKSPNVAISSDGTTIAFWDPNDRTIEIRRMSSGARVSTFSAEQNITALSVSPDGRNVLVADGGGVLALFDTVYARRLNSWLTFSSSMALLRNDGSFWADSSDVNKLRLARGKEEIALPASFQELFLRSRPFDTSSEVSK
jgi:uncharacterized caspase-like protein